MPERSSRVLKLGEKYQLLNLVFQNLELKDGNLSLSVGEPFLNMVEFKKASGRMGAFRLEPTEI
jgi:hypothetical protein